MNHPAASGWGIRVCRFAFRRTCAAKAAPTNKTSQQAAGNYTQRRMNHPAASGRGIRVCRFAFRRTCAAEAAPTNKTSQQVEENYTQRRLKTSSVNACIVLVLPNINQLLTASDSSINSTTSCSCSSSPASQI